MNKKTLYIIAIICCMSFFSSAKQHGNKCDNPPSSEKYKLKDTMPVESKTQDNASFDLSPLQVFVFGI